MRHTQQVRKVSAEASKDRQGLMLQFVPEQTLAGVLGDNGTCNLGKVRKERTRGRGED